MTQHNPTRLRRGAPLLAVGAAMAGLVATSLPAAGQTTDPFAGLPAWDEYGFQGEGEARIQNADARQGTVEPTAEQVRAAEALGATAARFNQFGTPKVLMNHTGVLAGPREGAAADIARAFVRDNAALFRLDAARVDALELLRDAPLRETADLRRMREGQAPGDAQDVAHAVMFRQRFGDLAAGRDGLLTVGVKADGSVVYATSSVTGDAAVAGAQQLDAAAAITAAATDVELELGTLSAVTTDDERFTTFASDVVDDVQRARLVALPTPTDGVRRAWEVTLLDTALDEHGNPTAFISFVDAETGQVWQRENRVDHFAQGAGAPTASSMSVGHLTQESPSSPAQWRVFPANPPFVGGLLPGEVDDETQDTRVLWCWDSLSNPEACEEEQMNPASPDPWDETNGRPTFTTDGNNATTAIAEASPFTPDNGVQRPFAGDRHYDYPWKNAWFESSCDPTQFGTVVDNRNDESAAVANLFVMHNRMHDWSYYLGFTEENYNMQKTNFGRGGRGNDPEVGDAQGGRRTPIFGRDNANQITLHDGIAPITNQYLWQPLAGAFYSPCVDGAYDMAVVAHEYGHAITNRMIAGPDSGTGTSQGQTESWSDLMFAAYFSEFTISAGEGANPLALGPYVTGDTTSAIRNYSMNESPLTYGELEYDGNGLTSPHANGEIWSAVNYDIFAALAAKYDAQFPFDDQALQRSCAKGEKDAKDCPGNRRWNQIQFDSFLLMPRDSSMVDSRDAMLAADLMRFDGANQNELWDVFAKRGLGLGANSKPADAPDDLDALPAFDSPLRGDEALVTFRAPAGATDMEVFVGQYEARTTPVADTIGETPLDETASFVPATYELIARAPGFGVQRFSLTLGSAQSREIEVPLRRNHASATHGGEASGDGVNLQRIIDDTEATNWASRESEGTASEGKGEGAQVEGRQVTVDLAGDAPVKVSDIHVSAALNGGCSQEVPIFGDCTDDEDLPSEDPGRQNRFSALRSFDIFTCNAADGNDCSTDEGFTQVFASADDAFPGVRPRPKVPNFITRPFDVEDSMATHVRLVVRDNQCTGGPDFQGETNPDNDPNFTPDCDTEASTADRAVLNPPVEIVRAAELQVFSAPSTAPRELGGTTLEAQARSIFDACPEGEGGVPRDSRQDDNGNVHEFAIDCMVWYEIAKGTSETEYEPAQPVNRAQMASFIARLIEQSGGELEEGDDAFTDDDGSVHEENINKLAAAGIVDGKGAGIYDPLGTVTRAQMAKFLVLGYQFRSGILLEGNGDYFADDNGSTHEANINRSAAAGFTAGRGAGYEPGSDVLRDQMASFLARTLDLLVEEGTATAKGQTAQE
jgi:extracellular elastinolytic metalloproteinase